MRKISILILILSFVGFAGAQTDLIRIEDDTELKTSIKEHSALLKSIKSNFIQEKHLSMLEEVVISKGKFLFKKEDNIRWEYDTPFEYTIIVSEGKFLIDNEGKISEFDINSNPMFKQISNIIVMAVSGDFVDNNQFNVEFFQNSKFYLAKLQAVNEQVSQMLSGIYIYFDKESLNVVQVKFLEPGDDFTLIKFHEYQQNIDLTNSDFQLN
ncbi:MAG: hypothetical protein C0595_07080 [Marinilabiliales bacterium]|nr:MAG: hypothetical protein C0595_07080 [Marinilabiliales bacterium]